MGEYVKALNQSCFPMTMLKGFTLGDGENHARHACTCRFLSEEICRFSSKMG